NHHLVHADAHRRYQSDLGHSVNDCVVRSAGYRGGTDVQVSHHQRFGWLCGGAFGSGCRWVERVEVAVCHGCSRPRVVLRSSNSNDVASGTDYSGHRYIAAGLTHHSKLTGIENGLHKVAEVIFGCLIGLLVSWAMSKVWPVAARPK